MAGWVNSPDPPPTFTYFFIFSKSRLRLAEKCPTLNSEKLYTQKGQYQKRLLKKSEKTFHYFLVITVWNVWNVSLQNLFFL